MRAFGAFRKHQSSLLCSGELPFSFSLLMCSSSRQSTMAKLLDSQDLPLEDPVSPTILPSWIILRRNISKEKENGNSPECSSELWCLQTVPQARIKLTLCPSKIKCQVPHGGYRTPGGQDTVKYGCRYLTFIYNYACSTLYSTYTYTFFAPA